MRMHLDSHSGCFLGNGLRRLRTAVISLAISVIHKKIVHYTKRGQSEHFAVYLLPSIHVLIDLYYNKKPSDFE